MIVGTMMCLWDNDITYILCRKHSEPEEREAYEQPSEDKHTEHFDPQRYWIESKDKNKGCINRDESTSSTLSTGKVEKQAHVQPASVKCTDWQLSVIRNRGRARISINTRSVD